ncbi:hypothetical protein ACFLQV_01165 [Calditrichota bacterium]
MFDSGKTKMQGMPRDRIMDEVKRGERVMVYKTDGSTMRGKAERAVEGEYLIIMQLAQQNHPSVFARREPRLIKWQDIQSVVKIEQHLEGRWLGFMVGLTLDIIMITI